MAVRQLSVLSQASFLLLVLAVAPCAAQSTVPDTTPLTAQLTVPDTARPTTPDTTRIRPVILEGFVITAAPVARPRNAVASHVTIVQGAEARARGVTEVADLLREVPGMVVARNGSFGAVTSVFFRGGESDYVKVLVDGVETNLSGGSFDFASLPVEDVERIEVVRGPSSALFGSDAVGGVIHVITRRGEGKPRASALVRTGSFGRLDWAVNASGGSERTDYAATLSRNGGDGILDFNNQFRTTALNGSVRHRPDDRTLVQVYGRYQERRYHFPTDGAGNVQDRNSFTFADEALLNLDLSRLLTDDLEVRLRGRTFKYSGGTDDQPDSPADTLGFYGFNSLDEFRRAAADLRLNWSVNGDVVLTGGAEYQSGRQRSFSEYQSQFGPGSSQDRYERSTLGVYLNGVGTWGPFSGNAGVRYEDNQQFGDVVTWQLGATVRAEATGTILRASAGTAFKEPTFFEAFSTSPFALGNPDLNPERSRAWEVGVEQPLGDSGARLGLTYFDQAFEDLIQYTAGPPGPTDPNYYNVAKASSRGVEAEARLALGPVDFSGGYTYLDTRVDDAGFEQGEGAVFVEGQPLIRRPKHQWSGDANVLLGRLALSGGLLHVGSRSDRDFSSFPSASVDLPAYTLVSAGADLHLGGLGPGFRGITLNVRGENLLNEEYQEVYGFRAPGRTFFVGARVEVGG